MFKQGAGMVVYDGELNDKIGDVVRKTFEYAKTKNEIVVFNFWGKQISVFPSDEESGVALRMLNTMGLKQFSKDDPNNHWNEFVAKNFDNAYGQGIIFFTAEIASLTEEAFTKPHTSKFEELVEAVKKALTKRHFLSSSVDGSIDLLGQVWKHKEIVDKSALKKLFYP